MTISPDCTTQAANHAADVIHLLSEAEQTIVARVLVEDHAVDLAIKLSSTRLAVVRCLERPTVEDHGALATMVAEGDFVWAGIVRLARGESDVSGGVETFPVSELDRLVTRLSQLQEAYREPR